MAYSGPVFSGEDLGRYCLRVDASMGESKSAALRRCR